MLAWPSVALPEAPRYRQCYRHHGDGSRMAHHSEDHPAQTLLGRHAAVGESPSIHNSAVTRRCSSATEQQKQKQEKQLSARAHARESRGIFNQPPSHWNPDLGGKREYDESDKVATDCGLRSGRRSTGRWGAFLRSREGRVKPRSDIVDDNDVTTAHARAMSTTTLHHPPPSPTSTSSCPACSPGDLAATGCRSHRRRPVCPLPPRFSLQPPAPALERCLNPSTEAFSVAVAHMYLGQTASRLPPHQALNGPISAEQPRSRASSSSCQATTLRRGPLRADHSLSTPHSANDGEIEDFNSRAAAEVRRQASRAPPARALQHHLSVQLHPTYFTDLEDDTDPRAIPRVTPSVPATQRHAGCHRQRVYIIKQPHSTPLYGRLTPVTGQVSAPLDRFTGVVRTETSPDPRSAPCASSTSEVDEGFVRTSTGARSPAEDATWVVCDKGESSLGSERAFFDTRTSRCSPVEHSSGSDRSLSAQGSPVALAKDDAAQQPVKQTFHVHPVCSQFSSKSVVPESESVITAGELVCACPEGSSFGNHCVFCKEQIFVIPHRDTVNGFQSQGIQCGEVRSESPSLRVAYHQSLPTYIYRMTVTDSPSESVTPSLVITRSQQSGAPNIFHKQKRLNEDSVSSFAGAETTEISGPAPISFVPDSSSPQSSKAVKSQPFDHTLSSSYGQRVPFSKEAGSDSQQVNRPAHSELPLAQDIPPQPRSLSFNQQTATFPRSTTLPSTRDSTALPSARDSTSLPSARDSTALPSARDSTALPSAKDSTSLPSARDSTSLPSARGSTALPSARDFFALTSARDFTTLDSTRDSFILPSRTDSQALSKLPFISGAYGSVDSFLVDLVAVPVPSPKKSKSRKSLFRRWFSSKKGKYLPGKERVPLIETPLESSRYDQSLKSLKCTNSAALKNKESNLWKREIDCLSLNINNNCSQQQDFALLPVSDCLGIGRLDRMEKPRKFCSDIASTNEYKVTADSDQQSHRSEDLHSISSEDSTARAGSGKVFSLLSSKVVKGGSPGAYENTTVRFNSNVTRHEVITITGSSRNSTHKSIVLNDSNIPEDLAHTLQTTPVMVREHKVSSTSSKGEASLTTFTAKSGESSPSLSMIQLDPDGAVKFSPSHGSEADEELLSTASMIVQAQRVDGTLDDPTDDHELVVIREYVFAAKKIAGEGGSAKGVTPAAGETAPFDAENSRDSLQSTTSMVREHDSGLDSPPSLQEFHPPPVKPKRTERASKELKKQKESAPGTAPHKGTQDLARTLESAQQQKPNCSGSQADDVHTSEKPAALKGGSHPIQANATSGDQRPSPGKNDSPGSSPHTGSGQSPEALPSDEENSMNLHAYPDKIKKKDAAHAFTVIEDVTHTASVSVLRTAASLQTAVKRLEGKDIRQNGEGSSVHPDRPRRFRDSLTEEAYNKPWESDFSTLEENIRSKITQVFPSAQEDDEVDGETQTETMTPVHVDASLESPIQCLGIDSTGNLEMAVPEQNGSSAGTESETIKAGEDSPICSKPVLQTVKSVEVHMKLHDDNVTKGNTKVIATAASASSTLKPATSPRKTSAPFERPHLPHPPPPPPGAKVSKEEPKAEEQPKTSAEERKSPLHHRKLKDKFKKVFSHSSEDKKVTKADLKKSTPDMKKDMSSSKEEEKVQDDREETTGKDHIYNKPEERKMKPLAKDEARQAAGLQDTEVPESDYLSPHMLRRDTTDEGSDSHSQNSGTLAYKSIDHEVKLPFPPKEAKKIMKAEKKHASKQQAEEGREYSSVDESKTDSPKVPNRAFKWIKQKLATTKGKKPLRKKKYHISGSDDLEADEEDMSTKDSRSPGGSDSNSASEDSPDSSESSIDSDISGEGNIKSTKKITFWGGKKDKKKKKNKAAEAESDSDSSTEDSKFKLFSWSLGWKKTADSSDNEDSLPSGYSKSTDWTPGEESTGVTGTFRKLTDSEPLQSKDQVKSGAGVESDPQLAKGKEEDVEITVTAVTKNSKKALDQKPDSELPSLSEASVKDFSKLTKCTSEPSKDRDTKLAASTDGQLLTVCTPAQARWLSPDEPQTEGRDKGEYTKLRRDARVNEKLRKQQQNTEYVLTRPLFLEDDSDESSDQGNGPREALSSPLRVDGSASQTERKKAKSNSDTQDIIPEDKFVPIQASRPVSQALNSLKKTSNQEQDERIQESQLQAISVLEAEQKHVAFIKPKLKQKEEVNEGSPALEGGTMPSKADATFRELSWNRGSESKPKSPARNCVSDMSSSVKVDTLDPDVDINTVQVPRVEHNALLTIKLSVDSQSSAMNSPRSNTSSKDSGGRTYLDKPGFLDVAKAHWKKQDSKTPNGAPANKPPANKPLKEAPANKPSKDAPVNKPSKQAPAKSAYSVSPADQGLQLSVDPNCSLAVKKIDPTTSALVSGVTLKISGDLENRDNAKPSDIQGNGSDPKHLDLRSVDSVHGDRSPDSPGSVESPGRKADVLKNFEALSEHHVTVTRTASSDMSFPSSPSASRRKTRAVTPAELKSAREDASSDSDHLNVSKTALLSPGSKDAPIDWLDSHFHKKTPPMLKQRPEKPGPIAPKPAAPPKISPKPKAFVSKETTEPHNTKINREAAPPMPTAGSHLSPASAQAQVEVKGRVSIIRGAQEGSSDGDKPAVKDKPAPPSKPPKSPAGSAVSKPAAVGDFSKQAAVGNVSKPAAVNDVSKPTMLAAVLEVSKVNMTSKTGSPEPKPRQHLDIRMDSAEEKAALQSASPPAQNSAATEESTLQFTSSTESTERQSMVSSSTSTWGEQTVSTLGPLLGDFTLGLISVSKQSSTDPSASSLGERTESSEGNPLGDFTLALSSGMQHYSEPSTSASRDLSASTGDPQVGDFTLGLEARGKVSEKTTYLSQGVTGLTLSPDSDNKGDNTNLTATSNSQGSANPMQNESEFTNVTALARSQMSSSFTPLSQSTPLTSKLTTQLSSTPGDVTLSTVDETGSGLDGISKRRDSEDIYEPIFFEDQRDSQSSRPTEAPPVRPEKVGKRRAEALPRIMQSEYPDDTDSTYDVPRTSHTFAFPTESSMPVLSIVDKRSSKTSLTSMRSLEPEDSIAPYATCHRMAPVSSLASDYDVNENPYVNEEEHFLSVFVAQSQPADKTNRSEDAEEEVVHASLKELFPHASKRNASKEDASDSEEHPTSQTNQQIEIWGVAELNASSIPVKKMFQIGSSSDTSSQTSWPDKEAETPAKVESKRETDKPKTQPDDSNAADAATEKGEDDYLKSPEYERSVDEINKLYAALEREEQEMERQAAAHDSRPSAQSTATRTGRLLSYEEQRAELKPLQTKLEQKLSDPTVIEEEAKTKVNKPSPDSKNRDKTNDKKDSKLVNPFAKKNHAPKAAVKDVNTSKQGSEPNSPPSSPSVTKNLTERTSSETAENVRDGTFLEKEHRDDGKDNSHFHESAFHRLKEFLKPGVKRSKSETGDEAQVKIKAEAGEGKAQENMGQEEKEPQALSTFKLVLPKGGSLEAEVLQHHHAYAQVLKSSTTSLESAEPSTAGSSESHPEQKAAVASASSPSTVKKLDTLSSFFLSKGEGSPEPNCHDRSESSNPKGETSPKMARATMAFKVESKAVPRMTAAPPLPPHKVPAEQVGEKVKTPTLEPAAKDANEIRVLPQKESTVNDEYLKKDINLAGEVNPASGDTFSVSLEVTDLRSLETPPALKSESPSSNVAYPETVLKPTATLHNAAKAPARPDKPKPPEIQPGAPSKLPEKPETRPQPKPRDMSRTYSDVAAKVETLHNADIHTKLKALSSSDASAKLNEHSNSADEKTGLKELSNTDNSAILEEGTKPADSKAKLTEPSNSADAETKLKEPTISDTSVKLRVPAVTVLQPGGSSEKPGTEDSPAVPTRHSSLFTESSPGRDSAPEPSKGLPDIPHGRHKNRMRFPWARAASESEDSDEEEEAEEDETEDDEDADDIDRHDCDSPPIPERKYLQTQGKYNEYSNVIRVDSTKLREARMRSLSRPVLNENPSEGRLRNALSLEGGLDKKSKKSKSDENGEKKGKKAFFLTFRDLFVKKKKKKKSGKGGKRRRNGGGAGDGVGGVEEEEEEEEEKGEEENVYEVVEDAAGSDPKAKPKTPKPATAPKHTWPKHKMRKKSSDSDNDNAKAERPTSDHQHQQHHHQPLIKVDSSHETKDIRPIGRLLQLNPDGTQLLELIRPPSGQLGIQLTQGNEVSLRGKFVSGFVDKCTKKLLSGILHEGDQILKINEHPIDDCPLIQVHDIIDAHQRLKFLIQPGDSR